MHATHTHTNAYEFCQYLLSTYYKQGRVLGRYPDISKIVSTATLIKSEHGLRSNVSPSWSHYRFIFVRCQSILIHLSSFVCDWFVHMNLACDFKPPYGDLLSRKHVRLSLVSAFSCSDRIWGIFSDPLQSLWLGVSPITYSQNPTLYIQNRCFGYRSDTEPWDLKSSRAVSLSVEMFRALFPEPLLCPHWRRQAGSCVSTTWA